MTRDLMKELRQIVEHERQQRLRAGPQPWHGYWDLPANESPDTITRPSEGVAGAKVAILCTRTGLPAKAQSRLVSEWCELLPTLGEVRSLWFHSRVPQPLFDAACRVPNLDALYVKWSGVTNLEALTNLRNLRHLFLGSSAGVVDIAPLASMRSLRSLGLENLKRVTKLEVLAGLADLEELGFVGADGQRNRVETLTPLAGLNRLRWLHLGGIHVDDGSLDPLRMLLNLRWLNLGNYFDARAFAKLAAQLPQTQCDWFRPFKTFDASVFPCVRCKSNGRVMTSGKGSKLLCPTCDSAALERHVALFRQAMAEAPGAQ